MAAITAITFMLIVAAIDNHGGGYGGSHDSYGENGHYDGRKSQGFILM